MDWRVKGVAQKVLSAVPGGMSVNDHLQRWVGDLKNLEANIDLKVKEDWLVFMGHLRELNMPPEGLHIMEIGTGWYPTLPFCFFLAGVGRCHTFDISRHLKESLCRRMVRRLEFHLPAIAAASGRSEPEVRARWQSLDSAASASEMLDRARVTYHAPGDACQTSLPPQTLDMVFSNSVLEHVPEPVIRKMMVESFRVLKPGGVSVHSVNCGDHYAYFDRSITPIHYLRFDPKQWRFWNNDLLYQNRLRPGDFLRMAEESGLKIVLNKWRPRPDLLQQLPRLPIAAEFKGYSPEELCCTSIDFAGAA